MKEKSFIFAIKEVRGIKRVGLNVIKTISEKNVEDFNKDEELLISELYDEIVEDNDLYESDEVQVYKRIEK